MIEAIVCEYLESELSIPARPEKTDSDGLSIFVEKTAGTLKDHIRSATLAIQSYADTMFEAAALNESVINAMNDIITLDNISASQYVTDYNFTDTDTKRYRYQAVFTVTYYE